MSGEELGQSLDAAWFARERLGFEADATQAQILQRTARRVLLNCTRQWGKSTIAAVKAVHRAYFAPGSLTVALSPSARQSGEFLRKASEMARRLGVRPRGDGDNEISLLLPNGSRIVGLPGSESTVRGFSAVSLMMIDEAARVSEELYRAVTPMLAVGGGELWLMSTPFGRRGFFWEAWAQGGRRWERVTVPATECPRIAREFLEEERAAMGEWWFRQEYLCEFVDVNDAVFDRDLVEAALNRDLEPLVIGSQMGTQSGEYAALEYRSTEYKRLYRTVEYFAGLDLGQKQDYTALAVVERALFATGEVDAGTYEQKLDIDYRLRHLERVKLGTSYPAIVERVCEVVRARDLAGRCTLVVDATGVGAPVMDLLRAARPGCPIVPVVITGGERAAQAGGTWRVPKRDLVMGLQVMFEERQLQIAEKLADASTLVRELMSLRVKISAAGHDSYGAASGAREGPHDDLVLAVALAAWRAKGWARRSMFGTRSLGLY